VSRYSSLKASAAAAHRRGQPALPAFITTSRDTDATVMDHAPSRGRDARAATPKPSNARKELVRAADQGRQLRVDWGVERTGAVMVAL
jgi:hypothetical protein